MNSKAPAVLKKYIFDDSTLVSLMNEYKNYHEEQKKDVMKVFLIYNNLRKKKKILPTKLITWNLGHSMRILAYKKISWRKWRTTITPSIGPKRLCRIFHQPEKCCVQSMNLFPGAKKSMYSKYFTGSQQRMWSNRQL